MKTLRQLFNVVAISVVAMFAFASCTTDNTGSESTFVPFDITYSTGEAEWNEIDPEALILNKLGVGATGTVPYLEVTSSTYWTVEVQYPQPALPEPEPEPTPEPENPGEGEPTTPEEGAEMASTSVEPWLTVTPIGGPAPAQSKTNVYLYPTENHGEDREAYIIFKMLDKTYKVTVKQRGPLTNANESRLIFVEDNFGGETLEENTVVKFYTFKGDDGGYSYSGVATAGDLYAYSYAGSDNTYASKDEPSSRYVDPEFDRVASGGANIMLDGKSHFDIRNFNNQDKTDFYLSFGAKNSDGRFNKEHLKLYISCDSKNWAEMDYTHTEDPKYPNNWTLNKMDFSIAPNVSKILYFRFENTSDDVYRIDDLFFSEYDPSDNLFPLIELGSDIIGLPVNFAFNDLKQGEVKGDQWEAFAIVLSEESGAYEKEEPVEFATAAATSAHVQFVMGTDVSIVKERAGGDGMLVTSSSPKVTGMYEGDYWIWTLPVHNAAAMTNVACYFTFMGTDAGAKYHVFEWAQCTAEEYTLAGAPITMRTDAEKDAFYDSLDWTQWNLTTIDVPNEEDVAQNPSNGIPVGHAKIGSNAGYWKGQITYSDGFKGGKSSKQVTTDPDKIIATFPDAMEDGYYFLRLRVVSNLTCGPCNSQQYQRMNKVDHYGTNYLRQTAKFSFAGCGNIADYTDGYKYLTLIKGVDATHNYNGGDVYFSPKASMGLYAGSTPNIKSTTLGNNQFSGSCPNDESGKSVFVYGPYDASNDSRTNEIILSVPSEQYLTAGALYADCLPFVMTNDQAFRTTRAMRCDIQPMSAIVGLNIYSKKAMSDKIFKVVLKGSKIGGSHIYNVAAKTDMGENLPFNEITATTDKAVAIPSSVYNATPVYMGVWEGTRTMTADIYAGAYYYTVDLPETVYTTGETAMFDICLDEWPKTLAPGEEITAINSGEKFMQFMADLAAGKTGDEMKKYRNIDGDYGFSCDIDMANIDMSNWPDATLNENFNGGSFRIKNLSINNPFKSLFKNVSYGNTVSNVIFDESCTLNVDLSILTGEAQTWAFLVGGGVVTSDATQHVATGNVENCVNYGTINVFGDHSNDNIYVGTFVGQASGANDDPDTPSHLLNCKNYGKIWLHDITQSGEPSGTKVTHAYYRYTTVGGMVGRAAGYSVSNCQNYGEIVLEDIDRKCGTFYIGAIAGYATNRTDSNTTNLFGDINNCQNYGAIKAGTPEKRITVHTFALSGGVGRTQWANLTKLTNNADITVYANFNDPFYTGDYLHQDWEAEITGTTNAIDYFCVGGLLCFTQCNIAVGCENTFLINNGNIYVECDTTATQYDEGSMRYADNCGICVGGAIASAGANAYNPHYNSCSNMGNVTLKTNRASSEVFLGGVMGKMASNRYDANYVFYLNGSSNVGTVQLLTDNPEDIVAHVGGVCGSMIYGELKSDINGGAVISQSTNPASTIGAILGTQHKSQIGTACSLEHALVIETAAVGGSVNGVTVTPENFNDFVYGGYQNKPIHCKDNAYFNYVP